MLSYLVALAYIIGGIVYIAYVDKYYKAQKTAYENNSAPSGTAPQNSESKITQKNEPSIFNMFGSFIYIFTFLKLREILFQIPFYTTGLSAFRKEKSCPYEAL